MKMEEMEMFLSFHMWNLQEEIVSLAPLVKEQEEFLEDKKPTGSIDSIQ